jgi:hypothetical protein
MDQTDNTDLQAVIKRGGRSERWQPTKARQVRGTGRNLLFFRVKGGGEGDATPFG